MKRLLPGLLLLFACGSPAPERVEIVALDMARTVDDPVYGLRYGGPVGLHDFEEGDWGQHEGLARWALGDTASIDLTLTGRDVRLRLRASTDPALVARGQILTLRLAGHELWSGTLPPNWGVDTILVDVPEGVVRRGVHRFDLVTDVQQGDAMRRAVFFRGLDVDASLDAEQRQEWERWTSSGDFPAAAREVAIPVPLANAHEAEKVVLGAEQPDLLVVVLDAARADHFSCYGYTRETSPHIDRLAAEGVRLENVWAEAPYTRSSVATMLTGRSWRDHGVVGPEDALPKSAVTLAEVLSESGYATWAISDNANVARSAGSDQGFDEFLQTWDDVRIKRPPGESWWYPELPVMLFEERIERGLPSDRPVFAYLHLMPPHEPYFPGGEHDVFGPEGYSGPITGVTLDVQAFDRGEHAVGSSDYERLVALYDGGLRRGDALVQRALDAWRDTGRERPLLTVFVSDHGEGFGEHGRFGHNSTPHDEMLRVPLILHPRELVPESLAVSADSMRSLADLLPLLVRSLGLHLPRGTTWPARAFDVMADPSIAREAIYIRCGPPLFARRSSERLSILSTWGEQSCFDLRSDPRATRDSRRDGDPGWWSDVRTLRAFLSGQAESVAGEVSEEDRERLRALGYL